MSLRDDIADIWTPALDEAVGQSLWSLVFFAPRRGVSVVVRDTSVYSSAGLIDCFLAELVARAVAARTMRWTDPVDVRPDAEFGEGTSLLALDGVPVRLPMHTVVTLMVAASDPAARAAVVASLGGVDRINDELVRCGYERTRLLGWGSQRDRRAANWQPDPHLPTHGGEAVTTARDVFTCLEQSMRSTVTSDRFFGQLDNRGLARFVPDSAGVAIAHKTATHAGARHNCAVAQLSDDPADIAYALCFTDGTDRTDTLDDPAWLAMGDCFARSLSALGVAF